MQAITVNTISCLFSNLAANPQHLSCRPCLAFYGFLLHWWWRGSTV